jgi:iron complex outermembrane receptor protein
VRPTGWEQSELARRVLDSQLLGRYWGAAYEMNAKKKSNIWERIKMPRSKRRMSLFSCVSGVALLATPVLAQDVGGASAPSADTSGQLEDIVVTAQKREENLQKVPVSIAAFSGDALGSRGAKSIADLTLITPGLQIGSQNGSVQPYLRGIGNMGAAIGNESSVAVYIDGVYYTSVPSGAFALGNVSRVEVLKGPQGTLFGRNASGGVIQLITRDPSHTPALKGDVSYGNYNTINGNLYATAGLSDTVAIDLSLSGNKQNDGWGRNLVTGWRNGYADYYSARSKLLFTPSDTTRITLTGGYSYSKPSFQGSTFLGTTQGTFTPPFVQTTGVGFFDRNDDLDSFTSFKQWMASLKAEQEFSFVRLTSISAYINNKIYGQTDGDWSPRPDFALVLPAKTNQFTQEFQLSSLPGSDLKWVFGLYYYHSLQAYTGAQFRGTIFGPGYDAYGKQIADSYAAYGQASYEIVPKLTLTGGLRHTQDKAKGSGGFAGPGDPLTTAATTTDTAKTKKVTFRGGADYQATEDVLLYASVSRGFKSLAYNILPFDGHNEPEVLDAYEAGLKSDLFDNRVRFNLSAFYYQLKKPQVQLLATAAVILSNADSARIKGIDFDITALAIKGLTLRVSGTYLDATYKVYGQLDSAGNCTIRCAPANPPAPPPGYGTLPPVGIVAGGNTIPRSPKFSATVGFDYVADVGQGKITMTGDYSYNSGYFFEPDNFLHQGKFGLFGGQIKYSPDERYYVAIWGKNLSDKRYVQYAGAQNGPSGYPFSGGAPRTYGVTAGFDF